MNIFLINIKRSCWTDTKQMMYIWKIIFFVKFCRILNWLNFHREYWYSTEMFVFDVIFDKTYFLNCKFSLYLWYTIFLNTYIETFLYIMFSSHVVFYLRFVSFVWLCFCNLNNSGFYSMRRINYVVLWCIFMLMYRHILGKNLRQQFPLKVWMIKK